MRAGAWPPLFGTRCPCRSATPTGPWWSAIRREYDAFQHATAAARHRELVPDRLVDLMAIAGTPEEVRAQVTRVATVPEIRRIMLLPQVPDAGFVARESALTLFAEEVMARLC